MKRGPLWIAVAAAVGVAAWLVLRPGGMAGPDGVGEGGLGPDGGEAPAAADAPGSAASLAKADAARVARSKTASSPRGGSAIVGVVRRDGRPAAAKVEVMYQGDFASQRGWNYETWINRMMEAPSGPAPFVTTRSGEDGRFAVEGIGIGSYQVRARAEDGARGDAWASIPVDGARVEANPAIAGGGESLAGRVVHADGRPFKGVVVVEAVAAQGSWSGLGARGDPVPVAEDGRFTATGLAKGQVTVGAIDPGALRVTSLPIPVPYEGEFTFTIDAGAVAATGRVVADADGAPVSGASVVAGGQAAGVSAYAVKTTTDADGKFAITVPPGRGLAVAARAPGFAPTMRQDFDTKAPIELRLVKSARAAGRVTAEDGQGVEGVTVKATPVSMRNYGGNLGAAEPATTSLDGAYALDELSSGEAMVVAEGKGYTTKGIETVRDGGFNPLAVTLRPGEVTKCDVVVVRGASVAGVVRDADGTGVVGAVVRAEPQPRNDGSRYRGNPWGAPGLVAATVAEGAFTLDGLVAGDAYVVTASAAGRATARSDPVTAEAGGATKLEIRLAPERRLEVTVLEDATGAPIPGVPVTASVETSPNSWRGENSYTTGTDGRALVGPLAPGAVKVNVSAEGWARPEDQPVAAGEATPLVFRLQRGLKITGKVVMPDKSPGAGQRVYAWSDSDRGRRGPQTAMTGADGSFTISGLAASTYRVTVENARAADGSPLSGTASVVAGSEPVTIELSAGASDRRRLLVRVTDPDGRPVPKAQVRFKTGRGGSNGSTVQDGKAYIDVGDRDDAGTVLVWGATSEAGTPLPYGPKSVPGVAATAGELTVKLEPGQSLSGFVRGPDAQGVRGALVIASDPSEQMRMRGPYAAQNALSSARTDAGGAFRLDGLGADDVSVTVEVPPEFIAPEPVTARAGTGSLDIALKPAAITTITVTDFQDRPVAGTSVSVRAVQRPQTEPRRPGPQTYDPGWNGQTDAKGVAKVGGLDPAGRFTVQVSPPEARDDLQGATLGDWAPREQTVRLDRGYLLEVRMVDLGGKPVSGAQLYRVVKDSYQGSEGERSPGLFRLRRLPAGEVTLAAAMPSVSVGPNVDDPRVGRLTTSADAGSVTIRIDPGLDLTVKVEGAPGRRWWNATLTEEVADKQGGRSASQGDDGQLRWRGLKQGVTYSLWIPPEPGTNLSLFRKGLRAGGEITVTLEKGLTITGRISAPAGATQLNVGAWTQGMNVQGKVDPDGRYELAGLPEGTHWRVSANARLADGWCSGQAPGEVPAGSSIDLEVKKR